MMSTIVLPWRGSLAARVARALTILDKDLCTALRKNASTVV